MGLPSVLIAAAHEIVVTVRNTTVFVLPSSASSMPKRMLQFVVLQSANGAEEASAVAHKDDADDKVEKPQPLDPQLKHRITAVEVFRPLNSDLYALLLVVDERRLMHYELDLLNETLVLKTSRLVPRSATCMTVSHLKLENQQMKHAVILGQKTGEAVAVPFPDVDRDLRMLLGHTTSMITHVAVNHYSSLLLTADRDEKLRVSRFPNAAIIESYCLGHKASLTKVACSAVTPDLVVSTSMDNTMKLWNMETGKLLASKTLLPGLEVSVKPLDEVADEDDDGRKAAKSLLNVSLAICPKTNVVAVLVNFRHVRFFEIVAHALEEVAVPDKDLQGLRIHEPCDLLFTDNGMLVVSYKKDPFVQLFSISNEKRLIPAEFATDVFKDFRTSTAAIVLHDNEGDGLDVLENGMIKKKARTSEWNKTASGQNWPSSAVFLLAQFSFLDKRLSVYSTSGNAGDKCTDVLQRPGQNQESTVDDGRINCQYDIPNCCVRCNRPTKIQRQMLRLLFQFSVHCDNYSTNATNTSSKTVLDTLGR